MDVKGFVEVWVRQERFAGYNFFNRIKRFLVFFEEAVVVEDSAVDEVLADF